MESMADNLRTGHSSTGEKLEKLLGICVTESFVPENLVNGSNSEGCGRYATVRGNITPKAQTSPYTAWKKG